MRHWAWRFYERHHPYQAGGEGPDAFDCWGLVRAVQRDHYGRELPAIVIPDDVAAFSQIRQIRQILRAHGWSVTETPSDGDGVVMRAPNGDLHVGVWLEIDGGRTLHCVQGSGVVVSTPIQLTVAGFGDIIYYSPR